MNHARQRDTPVRVGMVALAKAAGATVWALFAPRAEFLSLVCQDNLDQTLLDITHGAWARRREALEAGQRLRFGAALVCPLFDGPKLVGVAYFTPASEAFPNEDSAADAALLAARLSAMQVEGGRRSYLATGLSRPSVISEIMTDEIAIALDQAEGNVSRAARRLGLTRQGLYSRAESLGLDLKVFRARFKRGKAGRKRP